MIPVTIDNVVHNVFVIKRPGVDDFMRRVGEVYEVGSSPSQSLILVCIRFERFDNLQSNIMF